MSDYAKKLEHHFRQRYFDKISVIGIDPVLIPGKNLDPECLPPVQAANLYLLLDTSYHTNNQFKAFRSLNACNQMISGFITSGQGQIMAKKYLVCDILSVCATVDYN